MKIIVALNNKYIKEELEKIYGEKVYKFDLCDKEDVIELLARTKEEEIILITKDSLDGALTGRQYAKQIRNVSLNVRVIYIVEKLDNAYKKFLFSNEIINIIEGNKVELDNIIEIIDTKKFIIYKNIGKASDIKPLQNNSKVISVIGTNGAGKSVIASIIAKNMSEILNYKLSLIDMNFNNPSIDIINNLNYSINSYTDQDIENSIAEDGISYENENIAYVAGNINLISSENKKLNSIYSKILEKSALEKDISLIDLSSNIFDEGVKYSLMRSDKVLFVINPNYISIRQAIKYLNIIENLYDIKSEKIGIIVNKISESSLSSIQLKSLLKGYKVVLNLNYDNKVEAVINGEYEKIILKSNFKTLYEFLDINLEDKYLKKDLIKNFLLKKVSC